jgi:broad specificity phosphatase PhoE
VEASSGPNRVYLVRHGQSVANVQRVFSNLKVDLPLSELGVTQATHTAEHLKSVHVDEMYSSPMIRAIQTAEIFSTAIGVDFDVVEEFREVQVGDLEDHPPTDAAWALHDRVIGGWWQGKPESAFPNGDDYHTLSGRAKRALMRILDGKSGRSILVVAHGTIFMALVHAVCPEIGAPELFRGGNSNCSITTLDVRLVDGELVGTLVGWASRAHFD